MNDNLKNKTVVTVISKISEKPVAKEACLVVIYGMDLGNPDFVRYAQSYGAQGHRPDSAAAFAPLLRHCLDTPGVHLIDLPIDYSDNDRVLNHEIRELSAAI